MQALVLLLLLVALFWLWYTSTRVRETALQLVVLALQESGMQLLDGAVYLKKLWPVRLPNGVIGLLHFYCFEYTTNGADRYLGLVVMAADRLEYLQIEKDGHAIITTAPDNQAN